MRRFLAAVLLGTAAACSAPATTQTTDQLPKDLNVLFWTQDQRDLAFRTMETVPKVVVNTVEAGDAVYPLPEGKPLDLGLDIDAHMAKQRNAGLIIVQDGKVRLEKYALGYGAAGRWTSFSVAKSFTSTLLGAAIQDGHIESVDTPVTSIIPALAGTAYDGVTVGQIAMMTSGVAWNEDYTDPDSDVAKMLAIAPVEGESQAVTYARTLKREAPAGQKWVYKTLETNLLGLIVEEATGKSLAAYSAEKIVDPAGFAGGLFWMQDLTGGNIGGCCLSLRLSDYARFGQFVLEGGDGVVPEGWFAEAGAPQVSFAPRAPGFGYGYQWWAYPGGNYGAQGIFGQAITIVPEKKLVVAVVSNWPTATSSENRAKAQALVAKLSEGAD